jgi:V/A-type H+/Na+-transporting ATPase subunit D
MAKIKLTKSELKTQRDAMKQFTRFLPTLQLKKQQLQMEMMKCREMLKKNKDAQEKLRNELAPWIALFGDESCIDEIASIVSVKEVETKPHNIAGVDVPVLVAVHFDIKPYDLFVEAPWIFDAVEEIKRMFELLEEYKVIEEQHRLIGHELRVTTQRVNLFEKVKIPECKENIRVIQIYLGDQQTAAVGRSKIAKRKMQEVAA